MNKLQSGSVLIRGRKLPIVWTGQFAQHVAEGYYKQNSVHPCLHVEIQQMCQKAVFIKQSGSVYHSIIPKNDFNCIIIGEVHSNIFYPKTCYKFN